MAIFDALRPAMLAAARSPRLERTVTRLPAAQALVNRFIAGESEADAVNAAAALIDSGRMVSVDYLGENTFDAAAAAATVGHYRALLAALPRQLEHEHGQHTVEVSVKLSALGLALPDGHRVALANARAICAAAEEVGAWVSVDAESHASTDATLAVIRDLRADFPAVGAVLQAYLRRTEDDCRQLSDSRIRLCKGAYDEPAAAAYQGRDAVAQSYLRCLEVLMRGDGYPMAATHDPALLAATHHLASETGRAATDYEFQMLYGVRADEQLRLTDEGSRVRVYLPYGARWYGYFMRRLAERPANLSFFLRALRARPTA